MEMLNVDKLVLKPQADTSKEEKSISDNQKEISKMMEIIAEKEERIRIKKEIAFREGQIQKFEISSKSLESLIDHVEYFKNTSPFNHNYTFLKRLKDFYNHLDNYEKSSVYRTTEPLEFGEAKELIRRIKNAGKVALETLGSQGYRELLKSFTDRFLAIEKSLRAIEKRLKKIA